MSPSKSYDVAFQLRNTLNLHKKRFTDDDNLIIYPSAWYENFFEIMFRDKDDYSNPVDMDYDEVCFIAKKYLPKGWRLSHEKYIIDGEVPKVVKLQFLRIGEN